MPLRDTKRSAPHPLAITVSFVDEGVRRLRASPLYLPISPLYLSYISTRSPLCLLQVRRLRAIGANADGAIAQQDLWRGMRNAQIQAHSALALPRVSLCFLQASSLLVPAPPSPSLLPVLLM